MKKLTLGERKRRRELLLDEVLAHKDAGDVIVRELKRFKIYKPKKQDNRAFLRLCIIVYPIQFEEAVVAANKQLDFLK